MVAKLLTYGKANRSVQKRAEQKGKETVYLAESKWKNIALPISNPPPDARQMGVQESGELYLTFR